jgi:hypothetical protein
MLYPIELRMPVPERVLWKETAFDEWELIRFRNRTQPVDMNRRENQNSPITSLPARVLRARQTYRSMFSLIVRTVPSIIPELTQPT